MDKLFDGVPEGWQLGLVCSCSYDAVTSPHHAGRLSVQMAAGALLLLFAVAWVALQAWPAEEWSEEDTGIRVDSIIIYPIKCVCCQGACPWCRGTYPVFPFSGDAAGRRCARLCWRRRGRATTDDS